MGRQPVALGLSGPSPALARVAETQMTSPRADTSHPSSGTLTRAREMSVPTASHKMKCPSPCDPMDCSPPGSSVHGISQARILGWVAMPSSRGSSWPRDRTHISCIGRVSLYHWATCEALEDEEKGSKRLIDFSKVTRSHSSKPAESDLSASLCHPQTLSGPGCGSELCWSRWASPVTSRSFPLHLPLLGHNKAGLTSMAESVTLTSTPESDSESLGSGRGGRGTPWQCAPGGLGPQGACWLPETAWAWLPPALYDQYDRLCESQFSSSVNSRC